jgi:hypothetical protein
MDNLIIYNKLANLPENLKLEVAKFIDSLLDKNQKEPNVAKPKFGCAKGMFLMKEDFDQPLDDFKDYLH